MASNGYTENLLRVNLSNGKVCVQPLNMVWARKYIGCQGLGVRYLYEELAPGVDPLGPDSKIMLLTGPLTGTISPCSPKYTLVFKSPLTNILYDSTAGAYLGPELKYAGYDGIIIEGKAPKPVYLLIRDETVEIQDAARIWGKDIYSTTDMLKQWWGSELKVVAIGSAGENLVKFACAVTEYSRANGRGGGGAVFGSKNLKAIGVKGSGAVSVADPKALVEDSKRLMIESLVKNPEQADFIGWKGGVGTVGIMDWTNEYGCLPTRNFRAGAFEGKEKIGAKAVGKVTQKSTACFSCPMGCGHHVRIEQGPYEGVEVGSLEYESIAMLGANLGIDDLSAITKMCELCNKRGMDTIAAGSVIGWAMECYEKGLLTKKETDSLPLNFGNREAAILLLERISEREGIGDILAEGVAAASREIGKGSEEFAMHVKGLEIPAYDPRVAIGMGLAYAISPPGATHTRAFPISGALFGGWWIGATPVKLDPRKPEKFPLICVQQNHWQAYRFSTGHCDFGLIEPSWGVSELLKDCTGWPEIVNWQRIGERIINTYRMFSIREGITRKDDTLPPAFFKNAISGPAEGAIISPQDFEFMLNEYYDLRGWNHEGRPTLKKLKELDIEDLELRAGGNKSD